MVLSNGIGGAGTTRAPLSAEHGAQSLEFALTLPFILLAVSLLFHAAVLGADLVAAQNVAFQAARTAAVEGDRAVRAAAADAAGQRPVEVGLDPPEGDRAAGDLVEASVRLRSRAFAAFGATVWVPARATVRVERP